MNLTSSMIVTKTVRYFKSNKKNLSHNSYQSGFTLVELVVVVAILGVLVAIAVPNFHTFLNSGKTEAAKAELSHIQTAMNAMMEDKGLSTVTEASETNNMNEFPSETNKLYPDYMRNDTTKGTYSCISNGEVTQESSGY